MKGALSKYIALDRSHQKILNEACFQLARMRLALSLFSFKKLVYDLRFHSAELPPVALEEDQLKIAQLIGWAILAAAANLPWKSSCLVQAMVAQRMLKRRGIPGVLYLGAGLGSGEPARERLSAHAWVKSGAEFITGELGSESSKSMAAYSWA
jgi:hypothetical protein